MQLDPGGKQRAGSCDYSGMLLMLGDVVSWRYVRAAQAAAFIAAPASTSLWHRPEAPQTDMVGVIRRYPHTCHCMWEFSMVSPSVSAC